MIAKPIAPATPRLPAPRPKLLWATPPCTTEERLARIEVLGQRVAGYVAFMCQMGNSNGVSADAKEKAVDAFYEQMVVVEARLGRIHENFQLE
jgi:hypothetical protein